MTREQKIFTGGAISTIVGIATAGIADKTYNNLNQKTNNIFFWSGVTLAIGGVITMLVTMKSLPLPKKQGNQT